MKSNNKCMLCKKELIHRVEVHPCGLVFCSWNCKEIYNNYITEYKKV